MLTFSCLKCLNNCTLDKGFSVFVYVCESSGVCLYVWVAAYVSVSEWYCPSPLSPVWVGSLVWSLCSPQSSQPCQPSWTWSTSNGIAFKSISVLCWWAHLLSQISPWATSLFISNSSVFSPCTRAVMHTHTQCERTHAHTRRTHTAHQHINLCLPSTVLLFLWYTMSSWFSYKKKNHFFLSLFFLLPFPQVSAKPRYSWGLIRLMLVLSKCWLLQGLDRPCVFLQAFWGCESESSPMVPWPLT